MRERAVEDSYDPTNVVALPCLVRYFCLPYDLFFPDIISKGGRDGLLSEAAKEEALVSLNLLSVGNKTDLDNKSVPVLPGT